MLERQQGARVAHAELPSGHRIAHVVGQLEQAQEVRDRRTVLADGGGNLLLRQRELVCETAIPQRAIDRVEIFPLDVLDERPLEKLGFLALRHVSHDHGNVREAGLLRGPPAPFTGDDLVPRSQRAGR